MLDDLNERFESYTGHGYEESVGGQFFETLSEIEKRREQETVEVTLRVIDGKAHFEPSGAIRAKDNELWVGDKKSS